MRSGQKSADNALSFSSASKVSRNCFVCHPSDEVSLISFIPRESSLSNTYSLIPSLVILGLTFINWSCITSGPAFKLADRLAVPAIRGLDLLESRDWDNLLRPLLGLLPPLLSVTCWKVSLLL